MGDAHREEEGTTSLVSVAVQFEFGSVGVRDKKPGGHAPARDVCKEDELSARLLTAPAPSAPLTAAQEVAAAARVACEGFAPEEQKETNILMAADAMFQAREQGKQMLCADLRH